MTSYYSALNSFYSGMSFTAGFRDGVLRLRRVYENIKSSPPKPPPLNFPPSVPYVNVNMPKKVNIDLKVLPPSPLFMFRYTSQRFYKIGGKAIEKCSKCCTEHPNYFKLGGAFLLVTSVGLVSWNCIRNFQRWVPTSLEDFEKVIMKSLRKGNLTEAENFLDRMIDQDYTPTPSLFKAVIVRSLELGNSSIGSNVVKLMLEVRIVGDTDVVAEVLKLLMVRGKISEACQHLDMLIDLNATPNFNQLLGSLCLEQKSVAAMKVLEFGVLRSCPITQQAAYDVLDLLLDNGEVLLAYSMLVKGLVVSCDSLRFQKLVDMLNSKGYQMKAHIIATFWGIHE